ncbi:hypothetical protein ACIQLG_19660 [Terribacillus saccharophilus]|uniref:hypothetical protein n=1 Tax=Terribacillus saccharophilus TaxID=361277 RepID=UPI00380D3011
MIYTDVSGFTIYDFWWIASLVIVSVAALKISEVLDKKKERKLGIVNIQEVKNQKDRTYNTRFYRECEECNGSGQDVWSSCDYCEGEGFIRRDKY